jgi:glutamate carboxypeptidase
VSREALAFLEARLPDMVYDLGRFAMRETPSGDVERIAQFAALLAKYLDAAGATTDVLEAPEGNRHLRATWAADAGPPLLILGHFDTVWPVGTIQTMPFTVEDGVARGPGVFDMKAGLVQGTWAIRALTEVLGARRHIVFLCTSDEELGSGTSRELIEAEARRAAAVFVLEPSADGALKTARKGVATFDLTTTGRASHAGLDPDAGVSAIVEIARQILDLRALQDREAGSTVNVGTVEGGTARNVIAAQALAKIDVRFSTRREADRLTTAILGLRPHDPAVQLAVTGGVNRYSMERTPPTAALFNRAVEIAADLGFPLDEVAVGGGSDGNLCSAVGATVLDGLGAVGGGAHSVDEHVLVDAMPLRAALLCGLLASVEG